MVQSVGEVDLQPDPRILQMLGEINLPQWRCLAELIDNSVDGFLSVLRSGGSLDQPEVYVELPMRDEEDVHVTVSDNGPGMSPERLEKAMRAGWSGNNPVDSLGMFGMGFNIATARLGTVTTVWTSQSGDDEEHGLRIDFDELRRQRHFRTPRLTRPKVDRSRSGTTLSIAKLKPEQRAWFAKTANRSRAKKEIAKAYSAMLRSAGAPMSFGLFLGGRKVQAMRHCVWSEERVVDTPHSGVVPAVLRIDRRLPDRPYCTSCWQWLAAGEEVCTACGDREHVVQRRRHVHGWIGVQRFLSTTSYGMDYLRNGRKIEIGNRDLFVWRDPDTGEEEHEYPIDDPRQRGRFVGEIHLDHCRVTYMKDRFDRTDPAWEEMIGIVRGESPLQPQKARKGGYPHNESPLFRLFQAFRRSSPHRRRVAGGWENILVVKDNDRAEEMAGFFSDGDPEYESDDRWYELVEEEDDRLLTPSESPAEDTRLPGFSAEEEDDSAGENEDLPAPEASQAWPRSVLASLTREYREDDSSLRWDLKAFRVAAEDPDLGGAGRPWALRRRSEGDFEFLVNGDHAVFRSATMTELDGLLCELAYRTADFVRQQEGARAFSEILASLRESYAGPMRLDPAGLSNGAQILFRQIARSWLGGLDADDANALFADLSASAREEIQHRMAARSVPKPQEVVADGRFLEFAPPRIVREFIAAHPEHFFDGRCWEDSYAELDYGTASATAVARGRVLRHYEVLLLDAQWLAEQDVTDLESAPRERVLRAMLAVDLLTPTAGGGLDS